MKQRIYPGWYKIFRRWKVWSNFEFIPLMTEPSWKYATAKAIKSFSIAWKHTWLQSCRRHQKIVWPRSKLYLRQEQMEYPCMAVYTGMIPSPWNIGIYSNVVYIITISEIWYITKTSIKWKWWQSDVQSEPSNPYQELCKLNLHKSQSWMHRSWCKLDGRDLA